MEYSTPDATEEVKPSHLTKQDILREAIEVVGGRGKSYGKPEDNFLRIVRLWNVHMRNRYGEDAGPTLDVIDVALMMDAVKTARLQHDPLHHDSWVDKAGYAACGGELASIIVHDLDPLQDF